MKKNKGSMYLFLLTFIFGFGCDGCIEEESIKEVCSPNFTLIKGTNYDIEMTSATEGASIKYTIDGSDPKTSDTAVAENSVTIDFHIGIRAYAFKKDMIDSSVVSYRIPTMDRTTKIKYRQDGTVEFYTYAEIDSNENKAIEVILNGKGSDLIWFTGDDVISGYSLYKYGEAGLYRETLYSGFGIDGEWFTSDDDEGDHFSYINNPEGNISTKELYNLSDELQKYWEYTYNGANLEYISEYDSSDVLLAKTGYEYTGNNITRKVNYDTDETTVIDYIEYNYINSKIDSATEYDASDDIITYSLYNYYNIEEYYLYTYNDEDNLEEIVTYNGYGTDTQSGLTVYSYNSDGTKAAETEYLDIDKNICQKHTVFYYDEGRLTNEEIYSSPSDNELLYAYNYIYEDGKLQRVEKADSQSTILKYIDYAYNDYDQKIKKTVFIQPDPSLISISFNLSVSLGYVDGGYYTSGGVNYNSEGDAIGDIVSINSNRDAFIKYIVNILYDIIDNLEITDNGIIITGPVSGKIIITARVENNTITINYDFKNYDNGDVIINGKIDKILEGTISLTGEFSGSLNGEITGSLTITDSDPSWSTDEFLQNSYEAYEYNESGLVEREILFSDAGVDGEWDTIDDNITLLKLFNYDETGALEEESVFVSSGEDALWETEDDITDYHIYYTYETGLIRRAEKFNEYGVYMKRFTDAGEDADWTQVLDNPIGFSTLEYAEDEL